MHLKLRDRHLWFFPLSVRSQCLPIKSSGLLGPQYMDIVAVAFGISYMFVLRTDLFAFEVIWLPSIESFAFGLVVQYPH